MTPVDFRNATFADLKATLSGQRERVLAAWRAHGPCTTEELATRSGLSILTLRPRTTELYQLGFVVLVDTPPLVTHSSHSKGGCYRAATEGEIFDHLRRQRDLAISGQRELPLSQL